MKLRPRVLFLSSALLMSVPMFAHHSTFALEYDDSKPIKVTGVLTRVEWVNPHIWFYVDEKDATGKTIYWSFTGGSPSQLLRHGTTRDKLQPGMTVTVDGFRARDGSENGFGGKITFPDGRSVFTGSDDKEKK